MGVVALFLGGLVLAVGAPSASGQEAPLTGQAFGVSVTNVTVGGVAVVDVGPTPLVECPPDASDSVASVDVPSVISTGVVEVECSTVDGVVTSTASVANVDVAGGTVTATAVASECTANGAPTGSSTLADLVIAGTPVTVTGEPNQTVTIPGVGTVTINRQTTTTNPDGSTTLTVDALVIELDIPGTTVPPVLPVTADIVLSSVSCTSSIPTADADLDADADADADGYGPDADADDGVIDADADVDADADADAAADADADGALPRTGSESGAQIGIGIAMIGAALMAAFFLTAAGRRQRHSSE